MEKVDIKKLHRVHDRFKIVKDLGDKSQKSSASRTFSATS